MSESIFPFISSTQVIEKTLQKTIPKEYAWNFDTNEFILENGKFKIVEGKEAIKIWIYKIFNTPRYRYLIYTWNYGHDLESFIGGNYPRGLLGSELERNIEGTLTVNPYIKGIANVEITNEKDILNISFTALTEYGEVNINV